jgi:predicted nucleic-acid-binding protein
LIALDTNVLARYIAQDDPVQSRKAGHVIEELTAENRAFIPMVVLCELVWVLRATYKTSRIKCAAVLGYLLTASVFEVECRERCRRFLRSYAEGNADFCDHLIRETAMAAGCSAVLTFDKAALKSPGFEEPR